MELSQKERDKLWGDSGPYSQASIVIEERILDDSVSRVFVQVQADINPLTYEIIKKNRDEFEDDPVIQRFLDSADYRGQKFGYVVPVFRCQYDDENAMKEARKELGHTREALIKMHKYVMKILGNLNE